MESNVPFDFVVVGCGLFGCVFAHEMNLLGKKILIIEKRSHCGGNIYSETIAGIHCHVYGPHIFHTNDKQIWDYVDRLSPLRQYTYQPVANYNGKLYSLPFNMNTFYQIFQTSTPEEALKVLQDERCAIDEPQNLEEQALALVGKRIYKTLVKGYTEKQWGMRCCDLPSFIIQRLPIRFSFDNNYFSDKYQGIPINGYNVLIEKLLDGIEVRLDTDFFTDRDYWKNLGERVVFTGEIDRYFDYCYGKLSYRSLRFERENIDKENYQGCAVMNFTSGSVPYTRIIEHKHFLNQSCPTTVITKEYPLSFSQSNEPYYPVEDTANKAIYAKYHNLLTLEKKTIFGGRLGSYKYINMDEVIRQALNTVESVKHRIMQ